jgi:hypothetical protein
MRVLLVEDDPIVADSLLSGAEGAGTLFRIFFHVAS